MLSLVTQSQTKKFPLVGVFQRRQDAWFFTQDVNNIEPILWIKVTEETCCQLSGHNLNILIRVKLLLSLSFSIKWHHLIRSVTIHKLGKPGGAGWVLYLSFVHHRARKFGALVRNIQLRYLFMATSFRTWYVHMKVVVYVCGRDNILLLHCPRIRG